MAGFRIIGLRWNLRRGWMSFLTLLIMVTVFLAHSCKSRRFNNSPTAGVLNASDGLARLVAPSQDATMVFHWVSSPNAMDFAMSDPHKYIRETISGAHDRNAALGNEDLKNPRTASELSHGHGLYVASGPFSGQFISPNGRGVLLVLTIPAERSLIHATEYRFGGRTDTLVNVVRDRRYGAISFPWQDSGVGLRAAVVRDLGILGNDGRMDVTAIEVKLKQVPEAVNLQLGLRREDPKAFSERYTKMLQKYSGVFLYLGKEGINASTGTEESKSPASAEAQVVMMQKFVDELPSRSPECAQLWPCRSLIMQGIDRSVKEDNDLLPTQNQAVEELRKSAWFREANPKTYGQLRSAIIKIMDSAGGAKFKSYYEEAKQEFLWANPILKAQSLEAFLVK